MQKNIEELMMRLNRLIFIPDKSSFLEMKALFVTLIIASYFCTERILVENIVSSKFYISLSSIIIYPNLMIYYSWIHI